MLPVAQLRERIAVLPRQQACWKSTTNGAALVPYLLLFPHNNNDAAPPVEVV